MECTYFQMLKANALPPRRSDLFLNMTSGVHGKIVCCSKINWKWSMHGQLAKKRNVCRKEKVSKATMGYTRRIWLPPGILFHLVLITALLLKIFINIYQHLRKGAPYFDQVKRRSTSDRQNLLLSSKRCLTIACLLSSRKFESATLSRSFLGFGDRTLISFRNREKEQFHENL